MCFLCDKPRASLMECHTCFCIVLSVPPKITPFSFARDLNVGDRTSIQCVVVTGDLPLTFTWLKDSTLIEAQDGDTSASASGIVSKSGQKQVSRLSQGRGRAHSPEDSITIRQYDAFNSALSVSTIAPAHNGTYTCRVTNGAATVAHSALLLVNGNEPLVSIFQHQLYTDTQNHIQ